MTTACIFFPPLFLMLLLGLYFLPTILAAHRNHDNVLGVFLVNFLLGFTFIGWVVALVWALSAPPAIYMPYAYAAPYGYQPGARCQRCGCVAPAGTSFCQNCGTRIA